MHVGRRDVVFPGSGLCRKGQVEGGDQCLIYLKFPCVCPLLATSSIHSGCKKRLGVLAVGSDSQFSPSLHSPSLCTTPRLAWHSLSVSLHPFCPTPSSAFSLYSLKQVSSLCPTQSLTHLSSLSPLLTVCFSLFINPSGLLCVPNFLSYPRDFCSILMLPVLLFT